MSDLNELFVCEKQTVDRPTAANPLIAPRATVDPLKCLFNPKAPSVEIQSEQPEHRAMVFMKARGFTNGEIARAFNYSDAQVSQILRQPWARTTLLQLLNEAGLDEVTTFLKDECMPSLMTLRDIRDNEEAPTAIRARCADSLVDRFLGKPQQSVNVVSTNHHITSTSVEELDVELQRLTEEEKQLTGRN